MLMMNIKRTIGDYIMTTATKTTISKETIDVLKNFSSINSNILISPGNVIKTISPMKNIMSKATVSEMFDTEFGIWDLNKFLGTISLFDKPEFEFEDKYVTISGKGSSSVKYFYCEPRLLTTVNKEITMPDSVVNFELTNEDFTEVQRAASVLQLPDIAVKSLNDKIQLIALDKNDSTTNTFSIEVGDNYNNAEFSFYFKVENLKMIAGDYDVKITDKVVSQFDNKNLDLNYWIALESDSTYQG